MRKRTAATSAAKPKARGRLSWISHTVAVAQIGRTIREAIRLRPYVF